MSALKSIENPEVPGLECLLPPPPPPPPPVSLSPESSSSSITTLNHSVKSDVSEVCDQQCLENAATTCTAVLTPGEFSASGGSQYFVQPTIQSQSPTPWWVPNESDSPEVYDSQHAQWYEATYKVSPSANLSCKAKSKYYKRKSEFIDPAQDAEKVASAQRELSALMKPLKCDLCNAVMNSTLQAKLHYDGKPHQKKVSMFLNQSVKKLKTEDSGQVSSTTEADWNSYCEICKTWFTSQTDASQHYAGKKHLRAANGGPRIRPSKKFQGQNQYSQIDSSGRFGIGMAFQSDIPPAIVSPSAEAAIIVPVVSPLPIPPIAPPVTVTTPRYTPPPFPMPLRCDLCGISANRQDQLDTHRGGARHLRMLRINGLSVPDPVPETENVPAASGPIDYSIYRTPSGQYYCAPCNLSLNSESSFAQHVESKKHKNQLNPKSPSAGSVSTKKTKLRKK